MFIYHPANHDRVFSFVEPHSDTGWGVVQWDNGSRHLLGSYAHIEIDAAEPERWFRGPLKTLISSSIRVPHIAWDANGRIYVAAAPQHLYEIGMLVSYMVDDDGDVYPHGLRQHIWRKLVNAGVAYIEDYEINWNGVRIESVAPADFGDAGDWEITLPKTPESWMVQEIYPLPPSILMRAAAFVAADDKEVDVYQYVDHGIAFYTRYDADADNIPVVTIGWLDTLDPGTYAVQGPIRIGCTTVSRGALVKQVWENPFLPQMWAQALTDPRMQRVLYPHNSFYAKPLIIEGAHVYVGNYDNIAVV